MIEEAGTTENSGVRSKEEVRGIVEGFAKSGLTRGEYCAKHNLAVTTLDYWRRTQKDRKPKLVEVAIQAATARDSGGFALALANGRASRARGGSMRRIWRGRFV